MCVRGKLERVLQGLIGSRLVIGQEAFVGGREQRLGQDWGGWLASAQVSLQDIKEAACPEEDPLPCTTCFSPVQPAFHQEHKEGEQRLSREKLIFAPILEGPA